MAIPKISLICGFRGEEGGPTPPPLKKSQVIWVSIENSIWTTTTLEKVGPPWKMVEPPGIMMDPSETWESNFL